MNRIPAEVINDIRQKARIEDIIGQYIPVIRKGSNYVAYCPFHDDHDPSLHISVDKQIFKCFSCPDEEGSAGDVFRFVMKYKHVDYIEAVRIVAEMIGYQYDFGSRNNVNTFKETIYHKLMNEAMVFCQYSLNSQQGAYYKEYLLNRQITNRQIETFCLGYNPKGNALYNFLNKKGYADADMVKANLIRFNGKQMVDVFAERIMIPIMDADGHPIAFTARSIDPNVDSKYINSTDTPIFKKSEAVFNLSRAKTAIKEKKFAIIAEGPMDVMAFQRAGIENAVCSLGTATTRNQLSLIRRYTNRLLLAYDGDKAGQGAILKTGKLAIENGINVVVINNQSELDPDEIINKYGAAELVSMVEKPQTWIEFIFDYYQKQYDLNNYEARKKYAEVVMEQINLLQDDFDKQNYTRKLAELTNFSYDQLSQKNNVVVNGKSKEIVFTPIKRKYKTGSEIAQRTLLKQMLASKKAVELFKQNLQQLPDSKYNDLAMAIINYTIQNDKIVVSEFVAGNPELAGLVYEISDDHMISDQFDPNLTNDAIITLQIDQLQKEIDAQQKENKKVKDEIVRAKLEGELTKKRLEIIELRKKKSESVRRSQ